jgi:hypothetical protein
MILEICFVRGGVALWGGLRVILLVSLVSDRRLLVGGGMIRLIRGFATFFSVL